MLVAKLTTQAYPLKYIYTIYWNALKRNLQFNESLLQIPGCELWPSSAYFWQFLSGD